MNKSIKIPAQLFREGVATVDAEGSNIRLSICSDEPYLRYDWMSGEQYYEKLDVTPQGADVARISGGAALLYNHKRDIQLGRIDNPVLENGRCYVSAKLSNAPDVASYKQRIEEGILKDTSIGYEITDDGVREGERNGVPVYRFKFAIHEASLVTVPADPSVGLGRSRADEPKCGFRELFIREENQDPQTNVVDNLQTNCNKARMTEENTTEAAAETPSAEPHAETPAAPAEAPQEAAPETAPAVDVEAEKTTAVTLERERCAAINSHAKEIAALHKLDVREAALQHIEDGKTLDEFKAYVLEKGFNGKPLSQAPQARQGGEIMLRADFDKLTPRQKTDFCKAGGKLKD